MALALYRKYRPRTFAEVIGQEHVTEPLSQALRSGRLHHAYLFSGPRGCGKTSSARILARSLNCEQGPTPEPCGVCASCRSLMNDGAGSIDVIEIDAASHGGVDDARELREKAFFAPANSRYKIYVIDEAHMVSSAGFNALLKLVEEPPEYVKFIFATTEPEKVLGTIRSRTHHYPFRLIPPAVLRPYLQQLTEAEGVQVEPTVFPLVVKAGGGSARDTLSVLDQLIAGAGPEGVSYTRAIDLLGVTDVTLLDEMCDALAAGDGAAAYATIDRVAEAGHDPRRFASDLLERFRDLIVLQQVPDAVSKGLIDGPADQLEAMGAQAARLGPATLSRCADIVHNGLVEMRGTTAPRLLLELITARMLLPGAEDSTGALLQRLERMERRLTLGGEPLPAGETPVAAPTAAASAAAPAGAPAPAADGGGSSGLSAARAAAAAAARRGGSAGGRPAAAQPSAPAAPAPAAPVSAAPVSAAPVSAAPVSAAPASAAPVSAAPVSPAPVSPAPVSAAPVLAAPVSAAPASAVPVSGGAVPGGGGAGGTVSGGPGAGPDWNDVAAGTTPAAARGRVGDEPEPDHDEPPWDDEPDDTTAPTRPVEPRAAESGPTSAGSSADASARRAESPNREAVDHVASDRRAEPVAENASTQRPVSAAPVSAAPVSTAPVSAAPVSAAPAPVAPAQDGADPSGASGGAAAWAETPQGGSGPSSAGQARAAGAGGAGERRGEPAGVLPDAPEEPAAAAVEAAAAGPGQLTAQAVRQVWPEVLAEVKKQPRGVVLRAMAADATVRELDGETVILTVPSPRHAQGITQGAALIVNALYEVLGGQWQIHCEVAGAAGATPYGDSGPGRGGSSGGGRAPGRNQATPTQRPDAGGPRQAPARAAAPTAAPTGVAPAGAAPSGTAQQATQPATAGRAPHTQRRQPEAPASGGDDEWPGPAQRRQPETPSSGSDDEWPGSAQRRQPEAPASGGDDGWPEPAQPGGRSTVTEAPAEDDDEDWPEVRAIPTSPPRSDDQDGQAAPEAGSRPETGVSGNTSASSHPGQADGGGANGLVAARGGPDDLANRPTDLAGRPGGANDLTAGATGPNGVAAGLTDATDLATGSDPATGPAAAPGGPTGLAAGLGGPTGVAEDASAGRPDTVGGVGGSHTDGGWGTADVSSTDDGRPVASIDGPRDGSGFEGRVAEGRSGTDALGVNDQGGTPNSARVDDGDRSGPATTGDAASRPGDDARPPDAAQAEDGEQVRGPVAAAGSSAVAAARAAAARASAARSNANAAGAAPAASAPPNAGGGAATASSGRNAGPGSGLAAARAAAAGARGPAGPKPAGKPVGEAWSDGSPTEEAPYDPEFDGPPSRGPKFEGFDPGDEPLDEVIDEKTARESGEQMAMRLLQEAFGAEKIGES
ncbi:DNA polymerase III subunit gamma and tau [Actinoplanes sp. TRM 88003]|uniref:DNA-directed DNA polymerase n=1 Tax=Paractinoplanes aksuensis TaxID=2939490 RepID=A0ABT1DUN9_9ACTN|nr:DNA polymerase III subunit gamma and tau [Actinoplanes aksuensis]MCO8274559.1 DNA polymerase III subunit gamma and tau [Actinoplanes aksuensis]